MDTFNPPSPFHPEPTEGLPPSPIPPAKSRLLPLIFAIICIAILTIAATAYFFLLKPNSAKLAQDNAVPQATPFAFKAKVEYLSGVATKTVNNQQFALKETDVVSQGDIISTESSSRLVLSFDDGSLIRLDQNTTVSLNTLKADLMQLGQEKGHLFARVHKDENHKFIVTAGKVSITALGTQFAVEKNETVKVQVIESQVSIQDENSTVTVPADKQWQETKKVVEPLKTDTFIAWNIKENGDPTPSPKGTPSGPTPKTEPTKEPSQTGNLSLSATPTDTGIKLEWTISNLTAPKGFKVVKSLEANPVYPGNDYNYFSDPGTRSYHWNIKDGKEWHFRVCLYQEDGSCKNYSNDVTAKAPLKSSEESSSGSVSSISLNAEKVSAGIVKLTWTIDGNAPKGFKVVWSTEPNPVYPGNQYHYYDEPDKREDNIDGLDSTKTYYFRVCEYLGGSCGTYSNQRDLKPE